MQLEDGNIRSIEQEAALQGIELKIDSMIKQFPRGAFVRLGSRSPKDSYNALKKNYCYHTGHDAVLALCDSERISDDLWLAKGNNYTPHIAVREWIPIEPWQEFRCFVKNRKLVGISQYNYLRREVFPEILEHFGQIEWILHQKTEMVASLLPRDDVIVDFIYKKPRQHGNELINETILLEVNPYFIFTDPCLFNWSKDKFEKFEFRYCRD
jgi:hypothetical protein